MVVYPDCQDTSGEWGQPCPSCGQVLPVALPWSYGRPCSRQLDFPSGSSAGLGQRSSSWTSLGRTSPTKRRRNHHGREYSAAALDRMRAGQQARRARERGEASA